MTDTSRQAARFVGPAAFLALLGGLSLLLTACKPAGDPAVAGALPKDADAAWSVVGDLDGPPAPLVKWLDQPPTREEARAFYLAYAADSFRLADHCLEFARRFPGDERAAVARRRALIAFHLAEKLGDASRREDRDRLLEELAPLDAEMTFILDAAYALHMSEMLDYVVNGIDLGEFAGEVARLRQAHPLQYDTGRMELQLVKELMIADDYEAARREATTLLGGAADEEFKERARKLSGQLARHGKELELEFTDLDGRQVRLADYRGKVVMIDFWATWCVPCLQALPDLKQLYADLHGQGFEILGISFDEEDEALKEFLVRQKMTWPQHRGGLPEDNVLGQQLDIATWPTVWLVDKRGVLRDLTGEYSVRKTVQSLLAENF